MSIRSYENYYVQSVSSNKLKLSGRVPRHPEKVLFRTRDPLSRFQNVNDGPKGLVQGTPKVRFVWYTALWVEFVCVVQRPGNPPPLSKSTRTCYTVDEIHIYKGRYDWCRNSINDIKGSIFPLVTSESLSPLNGFQCTY